MVMDCEAIIPASCPRDAEYETAQPMEEELVVSPIGRPGEGTPEEI
jgi:hypothetical protein